MSQNTATQTPRTNEPERSRAVFSPEDFKLLRTAIAHYLQEAKEDPNLGKYSNLYHRLGRVA